MNRWLFGSKGCAMSDLAEVRRFWPKAAKWYLFTDIYIAKPVAQHKISISRHSNGSWYVTRYLSKPLRWRCQFFDGDSIAAAMAAAGFGVRQEGPYAERKRQQHYWRFPNGFDPFVKLDSRQRPRKGVRLGKERRAQAAKGGRDDRATRDSPTPATATGGTG